MSRFYSHFNTAKAILQQYKGEMPFSAFLKNFFSKEKKYGSRDRRSISSLCYQYFRTGSAFEITGMDEKLLRSLFLGSNEPNELLRNEKPEWNEKIASPLDEKLLLTEMDVETIFPFNTELSEDIDVNAFNTSFLIQPMVFVRVRPGKMSIVKAKLASAQIHFEVVNETCLSFANGASLEKVLEINKDVVIQDLNSQRVGDFLLGIDLPKSPKVWDCCAASGGKSIMAADILPGIQLTVSDIRQSIIYNLQSRFKEAGMKGFQSLVADVTDEKKIQAALGNNKFNLIICDAPCTGSGTWSRTPEQLVFFKQEEITRYSDLQKSIAKNTICYLEEHGYFLYITCSVFKRENEKMVEMIQKEFGLTLMQSSLLKGYKMKADNMFAALFQKTKQ